MAIQDDFTVDYTNKRIYHSSGSTVYSVNAFFTWLMGLFAVQVQMDDDIPMEGASAQQYSVINGWFIPDSTMEYLTGDNGGTKDGGSIRTVGQARVVDTTAGVVKVQRTGSNIVTGDIGQAISHDTDGDSGVLLDVTTDYLYIRPDSAAAANNFDSTSGDLTCNAHTDAQAAAAVSGESLWGNLYSIGSAIVDTAPLPLYVVQNNAVLNAWSTVYTNGHIDFLVKVKDFGTLIDSGDIYVYCREWGYTFDHFKVNLANGGRLPAAISVDPDPDNATLVATVEAYDIGIAFGSYAEDVNNDTTNENYEIQVDLDDSDDGGEHTMAQAYEYLKAITRRGQTGTIDGIQGQIYRSANHATYAEVKKAPFGSFAGGKFFGARGLYFIIAEIPSTDHNSYELIDSDNNSGIKEPISISVAVGGLEDADSVLVAQSIGASSTVIDTDQYTTAASGNSSGSGTVTITGSINQDTPASGYIRLGAGRKRYAYTSWSGSQFTLSGTLAEDQNSVDCWVPWLDEAMSGSGTLSVNVSHDADRYVVIRVRQSGIKPFQTVGQITSAGLNVNAIRTIDGVVS